MLHVFYSEFKGENGFDFMFSLHHNSFKVEFKKLIADNMILTFKANVFLLFILIIHDHM